MDEQPPVSRRRRPRHRGITARALVYAVGVHALMALVLFAGFRWQPQIAGDDGDAMVLNREPVMATVVDLAALEQQAEDRRLEQERIEHEERERQERLEAERRAAEEAERQRVAEEQRQREEAARAEAERQQQEEERRRQEAERLAREAEEQRVAEERARQEAEAERRRQEEEAQRLAEEQRQREEAERRRAEEERQRQEEEARRLAEEQRQREEAERRQREEEERMRAEMEREAAERQAAQARQRAQDLAGQYAALIQQQVTRSWLRPPDSRRGLTAEVAVRLTASGEVLSVNVVRSSGDPNFDRSVENAILRASPLPIPQEPGVNEHFRNLRFNFNPDDTLS